MRVLTTLAAATLAATTFATSAMAAPVIYFGENQNPAGGVSGAPVTARNNFLAALSGVSTESFETYPASTTPASLSFNGSAGTISATLSPSGGAVCSASSCPTNGGLNGRYATAGSQWFEVANSGYSLSFNTPIAAFGFYGTDIGDFNGQLTVTLIHATGPNTVLTVNNTINGTNGSLLFWGVIDTANPFTGVQFGNTASGTDVFGFDQLTVGDVRQVTGGVPEPATWAMMLLGFGAMGAALRRRTKVTARVRFA